MRLLCNLSNFLYFNLLGVPGGAGIGGTGVGVGPGGTAYAFVLKDSGSTIIQPLSSSLILISEK